MTQRRYAFRVRGDVRRARLAAHEEGLEAEVRPESTTARGWLPDQAALFGWLARAQSRGLEVDAVHRTAERPGAPGSEESKTSSDALVEPITGSGPPATPRGDAGAPAEPPQAGA
jgi:hypothetical protein